MNISLALSLVAALLLGAANSNAEPSVAAAAKKFYPQADWKPSSVLKGDFSCRGKKEIAILGTSKTEIVIAIFLHGLAKKPEILQYSTEARSPESAVLTTEDLDFKIEEFEGEVGSLPQGLQPSKTCLGLNMSDQMVDSAHIYWNRQARRFDDWVL